MHIVKGLSPKLNISHTRQIKVDIFSFGKLQFGGLVRNNCQF